MSDDQIRLQGMVFHGHTGVLPKEKAAGQDFVVDLVLSLPPLPACETDKLTDTVDYSAVFRTVETIVTKGRFDLIERLAGRIAEDILNGYPMVKSVQVTVKKPMAPIDGRFDHMAVVIERHNGSSS